MKFDIVIPTYHREKKLSNCIRSIDKARKDLDVKVYVYFNTQDEIHSFMRQIPSFPWLEFRIVASYKTTTFWNSHLLQTTADALIYLNDDILLFEDTLQIISAKFQEAFPEGDGVMGINQSNITNGGKVESAYGVIGLKYATRFPDKKVWCPDYFRFYGDKELGEFAESIGKFKYCEEAKIIHLHPSIDKTQLDMTHVMVREWLKPDRTTYYERKKRNYLWGHNFNLLHKD